MAQEQNEQARVSWPQRLRRAALFLLFATILLVPKFLALRRRRRLWNALRVVLAVFGAFLFADKAASVAGTFFGLFLILLALLVRPAKLEKSVDEQARELGALVALNGGRFAAPRGGMQQARLFIGRERLHVLDLDHRPLLDFPWSAVSSARAEAAAGGWRLLVVFNETAPLQGAAEFHYDGFFAEHLARIAETTLRDQLRRELPVVR